jgi:hypothetical protein
VEVKSICCYEKDNTPISKVVQLFISKKMVKEHCSVHSIKTSKGSSCIAPLSLSFGINGRCVLNITPYHFTPRQEAPLPIEQASGWSLEKVQMFCERRKFLASDSIQTAEQPVCSLASILT